MNELKGAMALCIVAGFCLALGYTLSSYTNAQEDWAEEMNESLAISAATASPI